MVDRVFSFKILAGQAPFGLPATRSRPRQTGYFRQKATQSCTTLSKQETTVPGYCILHPALLNCCFDTGTAHRCGARLLTKVIGNGKACL